MPIIYQHNINADTKLAVWHITEPEAFFLQRVPLKKEVSHPHKRLQHLAGRYLLPALFPDFPLEAIRVADTRRPFLDNEQYHFSISHCDDYAAAIVSATQRVGVDIETVTPKVERVKHKFVTDGEWAFLSESGVGSRESGDPGFGIPASDFEASTRDSRFLTPDSSRTTFDSKLPTPDSRLLTLLWSAKEVIFKWYGSGQLDFKAHMQLSGPPVWGESGVITLPFVFSRNGNIALSVQGLFIGRSVLSWTATASKPVR